jgi:5'(3')-deoxyribonucleotidase
MLTLRQSTKPDALQKEIDRVLADVSEEDVCSEEYATGIDQFVKLNEIKAKHAKKTISPDTWAVIAANLLGIALILHYERADIVTSKAIGFVSKLK